MSEKIFAVAVDGPSGAGKSTLSRAVAKELGIIYVDTGAIYRSIGYEVFRRGINPKDAKAVVSILPQIKVEMNYGPDGMQRMYLNGEDITDNIRLPDISLYASSVAAISDVRSFLLHMQQNLAMKSSVIMDGRDIGTVVLPNADVKIYLTASASARAKRRMLELEQRGTPQPFEEVLQQIEERDWADTHRDVAPLRKAEDAIVIDTSDLNFQESRDCILKVIRGRLSL